MNLRKGDLFGITIEEPLFSPLLSGILMAKEADSATSYSLPTLAPCSQEADLHTANVVQQGFKNVNIHTVDTDVAVNAISAFSGRGKKMARITCNCCFQ